MDDDQTNNDTVHSSDDLVITCPPDVGFCPVCDGWHILGPDGQCGKG